MIWSTGEVKNITEWNPDGDAEWGCKLINSDTRQVVWQGYLVGQYSIMPEASEFLHEWLSECTFVLMAAVRTEIDDLWKMPTE